MTVVAVMTATVATASVTALTVAEGTTIGSVILTAIVLPTVTALFAYQKRRTDAAIKKLAEDQQKKLEDKIEAARKEQEAKDADVVSFESMTKTLAQDSKAKTVEYREGMLELRRITAEEIETQRVRYEREMDRLRNQIDQLVGQIRALNFRLAGNTTVMPQPGSQPGE